MEEQPHMKEPGMTFESHSHSREDVSDMGDASRDMRVVGGGSKGKGANETEQSESAYSAYGASS